MLYIYSHGSAYDDYFVQAQRVRRLIQQDFDRVFRFPNLLINGDDPEFVDSDDRVDVLVVPTAIGTAPILGRMTGSGIMLDPVQMKQLGSVQGLVNDVLTVPASLAGISD